MEKINFFKSRGFLVGAAILSELLLLIVVFRTGMTVGFHKANFSRNWEENYERMFGGPGDMMRPGGNGTMMGRFPKDNFVPGHGITGSVLKVDGQVVIIKTIDNLEKSLLISSSTPIRRGDSLITPKELQAGDKVVGIGSPSTTGQIEVRFMRVLPENVLP